ncbi:MAG: hypothetical protein ABH824_00225 [Nanoarchaeota archaeon]|nr:hypothetical protein [Nanoarchaeota archaeon]
MIASYVNNEGETVEESRAYFYDYASINRHNEHDRAVPLVDLSDSARPIVTDQYFPESLYAKLPGNAFVIPNALIVEQSKPDNNEEESIENWTYQNSMRSGFLNYN